VIGGNFRLDAIQAAVVKAKLPHLDSWTAARQQNAARYDELFMASGLSGTAGAAVALPARTAGRHIFNQYVVRVSDRDGLIAHLKANGVGTEVYYPVPMHLQECFAYLNLPPGSFPESESAAAQTLALPIHPELSPEQARYVVERVAEYLLKSNQAAAASGAAAAGTTAVAGVHYRP
jgi:dTDP-4-amino-4,6-dideoxygalactose transaminase